jgi:hypothetical protein
VSFAGDDSDVESVEVETAGPAGGFDFETPVLDDLESGVEGHSGRLIVAEAQVEPDRLGSDFDRVFDSRVATGTDLGLIDA